MAQLLPKSPGLRKIESESHKVHIAWKKGLLVAWSDTKCMKKGLLVAWSDTTTDISWKKINIALVDVTLDGK